LAAAFSVGVRQNASNTAPYAAVPITPVIKRSTGHAIDPVNTLFAYGQDIDHDFTERTTFVIGEDGAVREVLRKVKPAEHDGLVLGALEELGTAA
jgi:hypothetical protein